MFGWVDPGVARKKKLENGPIRTDNVYYIYIQGYIYLYPLIKVVSLYHLSVLSMSVMGLKKNWKVG